MRYGAEYRPSDECIMRRKEYMEKKEEDVPRDTQSDRWAKYANDLSNELIGYHPGVSRSYGWEAGGYCMQPSAVEHYSMAISGSIMKALAKELKDRTLPTHRVYKKPDERGLSEAAQKRIGKEVAKYMAQRDHHLSALTDKALHRDVIGEIIRKEYIKFDGKENVKANAELSKEIGERWVKAARTVLDATDNIRLGLDENPIATAKKLRETKW